MAARLAVGGSNDSAPPDRAVGESGSRATAARVRQYGVDHFQSPKEHTVMIPFVLGVAAGYVLGARAGRDRYEQLAQTSRRVADHPSVQAAAGIAKAKVVDGIRSVRG